MNIFKKTAKGLSKPYEDTKQFFVDFAKGFWENLKGMFHILANHPEALLLMLLAAIGLSNLIAQMPTIVILPIAMEVDILPQMLAIAGVSILIALIRRRATRKEDQSCDQTQEQPSAAI